MGSFSYSAVVSRGMKTELYLIEHTMERIGGNHLLKSVSAFVKYDPIVIIAYFSVIYNTALLQKTAGFLV